MDDTGKAAHAAYRLNRVHPDGFSEATERALAIEAPISIEYNGIAYAVMMASPADFDDFAIGFSLSERVIASSSDILGIEACALENGWVLRIQIAQERMAPVLDRARNRVSEGSCGLCGLENLEQIMRPLPRISARPKADVPAIFAALNALDTHQPLTHATGAAHAAAFCTHEGVIAFAREDIGRHNALDKLIGALTRAGGGAADGFILLTARCSYELVEKTILAGCPLLVTISAASTLAVDRARAHGLTLISLARSDAAQVMADPHELFTHTA